MRVFQDFKGTHTLFVQPGMNYKECSDWLLPDGKAKLFEVKFINGVAEVEDPLGKYLVEHNLARLTRIDTKSYKFNSETSQKKSADMDMEGSLQNLIQCPDCNLIQGEPSDKTNYICENVECRRDFIKYPYMSTSGLHYFNHPANDQITSN